MKFTLNPRKYLPRVPFIITVNDRPTYAIIPFEVYKTKCLEGTMPDLHQNTFTQHVQSNKRPRWWTILFGNK